MKQSQRRKWFNTLCCCASFSNFHADIFPALNENELLQKIPENFVSKFRISVFWWKIANTLKKIWAA